MNIKFYASRGVSSVTLRSGVQLPVTDGFITADSNFAAELLKAGFTPITEDALEVYVNALGKTVLLAGGVEYPCPASQSLLSVTTLKLNANTVVATGGVIPFDTALRDDLGLILGAPYYGIQIPSIATQIRLIWDIAVTAGTDATFIKGSPAVKFGGATANTTLYGVRPEVRASIPALATHQPSNSKASGLIDIPELLLAGPYTMAGDATDNFSLTLAHNATAGTLSVIAGSSLTLEVYTPA